MLKRDSPSCCGKLAPKTSLLQTPSASLCSTKPDLLPNLAIVKEVSTNSQYGPGKRKDRSSKEGCQEAGADEVCWVAAGREESSFEVHLPNMQNAFDQLRHNKSTLRVETSKRNGPATGAV